MGGAGQHWARWYAFPITVAVFSYLIGVGWWQALIAGGVLAGTTHLEITLFDDKLSWKNYWWLPILGFLHGGAMVGASLVSHWQTGLILAGVMSGLYTTYCIVFSKVKSKLLDTWALQEYLTGGTIALLICFL